MGRLTHIDDQGNAAMVDVTEKQETERIAVASGSIQMKREVLEAVTSGTVPKGDVFAAARIAGIMAAKKTSDIIPLCHTLMLSKVSVDFEICQESSKIRCTCSVRLCGKTGAEMEALMGVSASLLTLYDMCKALDRSMEISEIHLEEKDGGKTGHYQRNVE